MTDTAATGYAGFGPRFWALIIDGLVFIPLKFLADWLQYQSKAWAIASFVEESLLRIIYVIVFHALWGQTLGKMQQRIEVRTVDGKRITWRHAFLRSSVELISAVVFLTMIISAILGIPDNEFARLGWNDLGKTLWQREAFPMWLLALSGAWTVSELIFLLTNKKRRALHDFIAGTVVVYK